MALRSVAIGIVGGIIYQIFTRVLIRVKIDDPIDVIPVHAVGLLSSF